MKKIDMLYRALLAKRVVSVKDILEAAKNIVRKEDIKYIYNAYLRALLKEGKLMRVKKGLYIVLDPLESPKTFSFDRFLVGSKISKRYYLGFHTALEFYGCAHSAFNTVYVCVNKKDRFQGFSFHGTAFKPVYTTELELGVKKTRYMSHTVAVSSRERTFIDCIDRVKYAGGWEECLKSLEGLSGVNFNKTLELLSVLGHDFLYRKIGLTLKALRDASIYYRALDDDVLESLKMRIGSAPMYLEKGKPSSFNKEWKLYVPRQFDDYLRGI